MAERVRIPAAPAQRVLGLVVVLGLAIAALTSCTDVSSSWKPARSTAPARSTQPARSTTPARSTAPAPAAAAATPAAAAGGRVLIRQIPGGATGFAPRPAVVYLPPAARAHPRERFPVLMLLHGTDGGPTNWTARGAAATTLDRFARAHGGRAPVVVMPDVNGTLRDDTECVRTATGGDVERYLTDVVPAWIRAHLPVSTSSGSWGVAGVSEGGTCALVLALRAPRTFSAVGDFSGLRRPTVGDADDRAQTIAQLFGGSRAAYDAHDPAVLLSRHRYPALSVRLVCGAADAAVLANQTAVAGLARRSARDVLATTTAGRHSWSVWAAAFASTLPWFWTRAA